MHVDFGDVVVMHHAVKKPPSFENRGTTGVCLGHDSRIAGGVLVASVVNGELKEVCSAKVRTLGEKVGRLGAFMFILKTPLRQPTSIAKVKSNGACMKLKYPLWSSVSKRMPLRCRTFVKSALDGRGNFGREGFMAKEHT